jgi:hypothetical protein
VTTIYSIEAPVADVMSLLISLPDDVNVPSMHLEARRS